MNFLKLKRGKSEKKSKKDKKGKKENPESGTINGSSSTMTSIEVSNIATNPPEENLDNKNQPVQKKRDDKENVEVKKNEKEISSTTSSPSKNIPTPTSEITLTNTKKDTNHAHASKQTNSSNGIEGSDNNDVNNNDDDKFINESNNNDDNNNNDDIHLGPRNNDDDNNDNNPIPSNNDDNNNNDNDINPVLNNNDNINDDDIHLEPNNNDDNSNNNDNNPVPNNNNNDDDINPVPNNNDDNNNHDDDINPESENHKENNDDQSRSINNEANDKFSNTGLGNVIGKAAMQLFSTSLLAAKPFFPWIESVTSVINEIVSIYETVEYNRKTCLVLVERVEMINLSVKALTRRREENFDKFQNEEYYYSFIRLHKVLILIKDFITDISELKGYRKFLYASDVKNKANKLLQKLEVCCSDLQFSIIITREMRDRDQLSFDEDVTNMTKFLKSIETGVITTGDEGKRTSKTVNSIYEEVTVIRQLVSGFADPKAVFNAPTIDAKDLHEIPSAKNKSRKLFKRSFRNTIPVACKIVAGNELEKMHSHLSILKSIQPSNKIIKFHGRSMINNDNVLVFEWAEHGNLKALYENSPLSWTEKLNIAHDIASGLVFLQACSILHHDLKCENILITGEFRWEAKIANFMSSRDYDGISGHIKNYDTVVRWLAPEKIPASLEPSKNKYDFKCEIFSFAMLLWELGAQRIPYKKMQMEDIMAYVMAKERENFNSFNPNNGLDPYSSDRDKSIINGFKRLIESGWAHERDHRATIQDIYQVLDGLVGTHSPRMSSKSPSNDTITNVPSETSITYEPEDCKFVEPILTIEEGIKAHRSEEREKAWKCFEIHATLGDPLGTYWMAYYYYKGYHVKQNTNEAIKYFKQAAEASVPEGQYYYALALMKAKRSGFIEYLTKSANNGHPPALYELGRIYYDGNGAEVNKEKGIQYLKLSALKGYSAAIDDLNKKDTNLLASLISDKNKE